MANPLICVFNPVTSFIDEVQSISQAQNPPVIGAPIVTNINGLIDASLVGAGVPNITAGESVSGGNLVSLYSVGGVLKMQLAWAGTGGSGPSGQSYPISANGFVTAGTTINGFGVVLFGGIFTYIDSNTEFGPGDVGSEVYLDIRPGNKGGITKLRPSGIGQLQQTVGQVVNFTSPNVVQVSFVSIPNPPLLNFSNISSGTNTAATMTVGAGATLTQTGGGIINANQLTSDPVNTSGRTTGQALVFNGTTWVPSSAPATTFSAITSGANSTATMTVTTGAVLTFSGSGTVNANQLVGVTVSGVAPSVGQVLTATSPTAAHWATSSGAPGGANTDVQYNNSGTFGGDANFTWDPTTGSLSAGKSGIGGSGAFTILFDLDTTSGKQNQIALGDGFVNIGANIPGSNTTIIADQIIQLEPTNGFVQVGGSIKIGYSTPSIGYFGTAPTVQATVTGSRNGNAALGSLLTALSANGFLVDTTTAGTASTPGGSPTNIQFNNTGSFGGIPGSSADGTNGLMSLAPTGTGVAFSVTGDATSDIIEMFTNAASPVFSLNKFGAATHTVTRTGGTVTTPFYNGTYVQHNTTGGGTVIIVTGLSSSLTYLGTAGDPIVSLITGMTAFVAVDGTTTDNLQSLTGAQISSNTPTAYVGNVTTGVFGANISTEHQGSGSTAAVEALVLTAGGNNQAAPVTVVSGLHVMQPQGGIMNFTGTTSVSGVVIDNQSSAPPTGATVAALRIKNQTGTGTAHYAILVDSGASAVKGLAPNLVTKIADYTVTRNDFTINVDATTPPNTFAVTAAATAVSGTTDYTGTFTGGAGNAWVGYYITISGFGNNNNNGSWICSASSATTITLANGAGVAEVSAATATWFLITLPTTNLVANQIFRVKKIDASGPPTNAVTVISTANIDFTTAPGSVGLTASLQAVEVQWDGTQYWIY